MQSVVDWLFRTGLYWGIKVKVPKCLILSDSFVDGQFVQSVTFSLNEQHEMAKWLLDCDGPWKIKARKTSKTVIPGLSFARVEDAVMFCLLAP
jgi:hypothetical protein